MILDNGKPTFNIGKMTLGIGKPTLDNGKQTWENGENNIGPWQTDRQLKTSI